MTQLRWIISRFAEADTPEWTPPDEDELRQHFDVHYLGLVPPDTLTGLLSAVVKRLRDDLTEVRAEPLRLRARAADLRVEATTEAEPPHRLRMYPLETTVRDPRVEATRTSGVVPDEAVAVAAESFTELGLVGLIVAGATTDGSVWVTAHGWADFERDDTLLPEHRFPRVVDHRAGHRDGRPAAGRRRASRAGTPANAYPRTIHLADDAVTVRELLCHTGGVDAPTSLFAGHVPDLVSVTAPVAACGGTRGTFAYANGGYALFGQLIADLTGLRYEQAVTRMVLEPLGMSSSWSPRGAPSGNVAVGHRPTEEGVFEREPTRAAVADLVRFGLAWSSLLPDELAREALRPQADRDDGPGGPAWPRLGASAAQGHRRATRRRFRLLRVSDHQARPRGWAIGRPHQPAGPRGGRQRASGSPDHLSEPAGRATRSRAGSP